MTTHFLAVIVRLSCSECLSTPCDCAVPQVLDYPPLLECSQRASIRRIISIPISLFLWVQSEVTEWLRLLANVSVGTHTNVQVPSLSFFNALKCRQTKRVLCIGIEWVTVLYIERIHWKCVGFVSLLLSHKGYNGVFNTCLSISQQFSQLQSRTMRTTSINTSLGCFQRDCFQYMHQ